MNLNCARGGANRLDVHVNVVEFEKTHKVGERFDPDPRPWSINPP